MVRLTVRLSEVCAHVRAFGSARGGHRVLPHFAVDGPCGDTEELSGEFLVAASHLERFLNNATFDGVKRSPNRDCDVTGVSGRGGDPVGEVIDVKDVVFIEDDGVFNGVLQLSNVTRPWVGDEGELGRVGQGRDRALIAFSIELDEVCCEEGDIILSRAQGWGHDIDDVESVVEVFTETPSSDLFFEVFVCGGDDPDVDLNRGVRAKSDDLTFLKDAEQFDLHGEGEVANFIKKEGGVVCGLKASLTACRPCVCAFLGAEEFGLHDRFWEGGAVDDDKVFVSSFREVMDSASEELFSGPRLAGQEDRRARRGDLVDDVGDIPECWAGADDGALNLEIGEEGFERPILRDKRLTFKGEPNALDEFGAFDGFGDKVIGASFHSVDGLFDGGEGGHEKDLSLRGEGSRGFEEVHAVHFRHHEICDDDIDGVCAKEVKGFSPI